MASGKTDQLVKQLRQWYESHSMPQKDLAATLDLSPQQLAEIFGGRNRPTGPQVLEIIAFLNNENMKPERIDPPAPPRQPIAEHPDQPRTLHDAKERIAELIAQLKQRGGSVTMTAPVTTPAPANRISIVSATARPSAKVATPDPNTGPMTIKKAPPFPKSVDAPVAIQKILDGMSADELRTALTGELDPLRMRLVYRELKRREKLLSY